MPVRVTHANTALLKLTAGGALKTTLPRTTCRSCARSRYPGSLPRVRGAVRGACRAAAVEQYGEATTATYGIFTSPSFLSMRGLYQGTEETASAKVALVTNNGAVYNFASPAEGDAHCKALGMALCSEQEVTEFATSTGVNYCSSGLDHQRRRLVRARRHGRTDRLRGRKPVEHVESPEHGRQRVVLREILAGKQVHGREFQQLLRATAVVECSQLFQSFGTVQRHARYGELSCCFSDRQWQVLLFCQPKPGPGQVRVARHAAVHQGRSDEVRETDRYQLLQLRVDVGRPRLVRAARHRRERRGWLRHQQRVVHVARQRKVERLVLRAVLAVRPRP